MSTLFLRLHNFLTDILLWLNPTWEDDQLFEEARRILIAMYQHIVYYEFVPVLIGYEYAKKYDLMPTFKKFQELYDPKINPATLNSFSTAAFRIFHSFYPASLSLINEHKTVVKNISFTEFNDVHIMDADVLDQLVRGAITQPLFSNQTIPDRTKLYISDIQRSRDHGLPSYNDFRELCQLRRILDFKELQNVMDSEDVVKLAELYADVDDIDLYVGGILEYEAKDATVGPTFQCLIAEAFYRYKYGDRFFYEHKNIPAKFTKEQLQEIKKATAGHLICTSSNAIEKVQSNVFYTAFDLNRRTECASIFRPDYSQWQEKPEAPKRYFNLQ